MKSRLPGLLLIPLCLFQISMADAQSSFGLPYFGFNAKGSVMTEVQTRLTDEYLSKLEPEAVKNLVIRVTGGTLSQTTYPDDWTDEMIREWTELQKRHGFRMAFVVNGNDSPKSQSELIQRWLDLGAGFDFIEMMNETYLPKYLRGDTKNHPEVTEAVTPEKYMYEILPEFWSELDRFKLPYYVCLARENPVNHRQKTDTDHWNAVVLDAISNRYKDRNLNVTIHLYTLSAIKDFNYGQLDQIRSQIPAGRHIAVTEAGILDRSSMSGSELGQMTVTHFKRIISHLRPGDYLLDQVLFSPAPYNKTADLSPKLGITEKGKIMLEFIRSGLK